jgi:hypothetical protein
VSLREGAEVGDLFWSGGLHGAEAGFLKIALLFLKVCGAGRQAKHEKQGGDEEECAFHAG